MSLGTILFGPRRSLKRGLVVNISAALTLCMLLAGVVLISEFVEHLEENLEEALLDEATEVIGLVDPNRAGFGLDASALRFQGVEGNFRYTVFHGNGELVAGGETSEAIWRQLAGLELGTPQSIALPGDRVGLGLRALIMEQDFIVLVSTYPRGGNQTQLSKLLHEAEEGGWWAGLGVLLVITAALFATRQSLLPLRALSEQAREIGPDAANRRLDAGNIPSEFVPLIADVNWAFDRLEQGYKAQRDFSSNVAHEIRTPLAVLKSSIERISDPDLKQNLTQDADRLDRIFSQLIDLARADAASMLAFLPVDLHAVATETATTLARDALRMGLSLSVTGDKGTQWTGNAGLLSIALSNLIRNALQHSKPHSEVEIVVTANPPGWRVLDRGPGVPDALKTGLFERFNRGVHAHGAGTGSGIGLAIVKSVAECHDASVIIEDRAGGGSIFSFTFSGSRRRQSDIS